MTFIQIHLCMNIALDFCAIGSAPSDLSSSAAAATSFSSSSSSSNSSPQKSKLKQKHNKTTREKKTSQTAECLNNDRR